MQRPAIVLLAHDIAPSTAFGAIAPVLQGTLGNDYEVKTILGKGKDISLTDEQIAHEASSAKLLMVGMSAPGKNARQELVALAAADASGVRYGFFADTFGCHNRPWFADFRQDARFVFVVGKNDESSARNLFPNAIVDVSGNPVWEGFFTPSTNRDEVRTKLGVPDDAKMILCSAHKDVAITFGTMMVVVDALSSVRKNIPIIPIMSPHPSDQNPPEFYESLVKLGNVGLRIVYKSEMGGSDLLVGSDLLIQVASTLGVEAACQRKPVIDVMSEVALNRNVETFGQREWALCEAGVSLRCDLRWTELARYIKELFHGTISLFENQEKEFPVPIEKGASVRKIVETLSRFALAS